VIYLVTTRPETEDAITVQVEVADLHELAETFVSGIRRLADGDAILIRRADYLDTAPKVEVESPRRKFTLVKGGKHQG
jgi:hypothetical protein